MSPVQVTSHNMVLRLLHPFPTTTRNLYPPAAVINSIHWRPQALIKHIPQHGHSREVNRLMHTHLLFTLTHTISEVQLLGRVDMVAICESPKTSFRRTTRWETMRTAMTWTTSEIRLTTVTLQAVIFMDSHMINLSLSGLIVPLPLDDILCCALTVCYDSRCLTTYE